jgi:hypothetical protein
VVGIVLLPAIRGSSSSKHEASREVPITKEPKGRLGASVTKDGMVSVIANRVASPQLAARTCPLQWLTPSSRHGPVLCLADSTSDKGTLAM